LNVIRADSTEAGSGRAAERPERLRRCRSLKETKMNEPNLQTFRIPFSADGMGFGTLVIEARAIESSSEGESALPLRSISPGLATGQPPALVFSTPNFAPGATSVAVHTEVSPQLGSALPDAPVKVEITLGPTAALDGTQFSAGEVIKHCQVRISDTQIEWETEPAHFKQGDRIVIPADSRSEFTLVLRARKLIPGQGVLADDENIEFTHMLQPGSFPPPVKDVLAPVERPVERREERSRWKSVRTLPDPTKNIKLPAQCCIRVKAWGPKGAVTRVDWERVSLSSQAVLKDLIMIPVVLVEPKLKVELLEPPAMPIPANGEPQDLTLQLSWDFGEASAPGENRATGLEITVEQKEDPAGKLESKYEQPAQPTDSEGKVTFKYTPPKLTYRPGGRYHEDFNVYAGKGETRRKIGECRITLAPEIRIRFIGEKQREHKGEAFGLIFDVPREVLIPAEKKIESIRGTARLTSSHMAGGEKVLPVAGATIKVECWNGQDFVADPSGKPEFETDDKGVFSWEIRELIGPSGKRDDGLYTLDQDTEDPLAALNKKAEELITFYEEKVNRYCPFSILSADLGDRLKKYRLVFTEQLASRKVIDFVKIISGVEVLKSAATYAHSYNQFYENVARIVVEQLRDLFMALIEVGLAFYNVAEKIAGAISNRVAASGQSGWIRWLRDHVGTPIFDKCRAMCHWLAERLQQLSRAPSPGGAPLSDWERFIARILVQAQKVLQESELVPLLTGTLSVITQYVVGFIGNWFRQALHKLELRIIGRLANLLFGANRRELIERWVSQIIEDTIKAIINALVTVATDVQGGRRPYLDFARLFNIFVPVAEAALNDVHRAASQLTVPEDYETRQEDLKNGFASLRDAGLQWELEGIQNDLAMEFIGMTMTYVQYFLIALATFTTVIGGAVVAGATRGISIAWGGLRGAIRLLGPLRAAIASAAMISAHYRLQVNRLIQ
jgi:hypothetical protein